MRTLTGILLLVFAVTAQAATIDVRVLQNRFLPEVVEIDPGDTVIWTVERGRHRLVAEGLAGFGSGSLVEGQSYSFTFNDAGEIFYASEGAEGMTGAVAVRSTDPDYPIGLEISAGWFDPAASGQGLLFEYVPSTNTLVVLWFTYAVEGGEQLWLIGTGNPAGGRVSLEMLRTEGGKLDDPQPVSRLTWGELTLDFSDCSNATAFYNAAEDGRSGRIDLSRLYLTSLCGGGK